MRPWRGWSTRATSQRPSGRGPTLLLKAEARAEGPAWTDAPMAEALEVSVATIHRTRPAYVGPGVEGALARQRPTGRQCRTLDGAQAARLAALTCRPPPAGQARWTLRAPGRPAGHPGAIVERWARKPCGGRSKTCPQAVAESTRGPAKGGQRGLRLRDGRRVGGVYPALRRPAPSRLSRRGEPAVGGRRDPPLPVQPGYPARQDYEYERCGTAHRFMRFEPLAGQRPVQVTDQRTNADVAVMLREVAEVTYADADPIVLVMDNLNTHTLAVRSQVYPPEDSAAVVRTLRGASHADTRQLAPPGGNGTVRAGAAMPRPADREPGPAEAGGGCLGGQAPSGAGASGLAVYHR